MKKLLLPFLTLFIVIIAQGQNVYTLNPIKDNTIFSESVNLSAGAEIFIFSGRNNQGDDRRSLLKFDVSSVPISETVTDVTLKLTASGSQTSGGRMISVHSLTQDWGEGTSSNPSNPGQGGTATTADCSWAYTFWSIGMWTNPGGDFDAAPIATTSVDGIGPYTWSDPALKAKIEEWIAGTTTNNGIIIIGDEGTNQTAKKFNSREAVSNPPELIITTSATTALSSSVKDPKFNILPNPVNESFRINGNRNIDKLEVYDLKGSRVKILENDLSDHNVKDLNRGIYLLKIQGKGYSVTQKLIKK